MLDTSDGLNARMDTLRAISRALARPLDDLGVLRAAHAELSRALDVTMCFFGRFDLESQSVEVVWQMHDGNELPGGQFPLGSGPTSQAIRACQPQLIRNWSASGPTVQVQYATERPTLPESSIVVPVIWADQVVGVLAIQSYEPAAYDEDDVQLLEAVAALLAVALFGRSSVKRLRRSESEAILASMDEALLVLDPDGRVVRLNGAARRLLCVRAGGVVFGQPLDRPQSERWPLGTERVSQQLRPVMELLQQGAAPEAEIELTLEDGPFRCHASVLRHGQSPAGAVMILRRSA
jgi:putative methionine-R-sulfoxide reductase with GAF domain